MNVSDTVKSVTFNGSDDFDILAGGGTLTINEGITTTTANQFGIAAPVTLGASQSFDVFDGSILTVSGDIDDGSNGYAITKTSNGTLTLSGNNTHSGGTTLTQGTITLGHDNALGTGGLTLGGNGILQSNNDTRTVSNAIANGGNVLTTSGDNNLALSGVISGTGTLTKEGTGLLTLSGNNIYTGDTTLSAGTLYLTGQLFGDVVVNGGTFMGTGTIANSGNLTLNSGGSFAPGASIGTTNITGDYVQNSGSTLEIEVFKAADNSLSSDLLDVTGTATLESGSTINVTDLTPSGRYLMTNDAFTIITTGGGVTDNGADVTSSSTSLSFDGSVSGNDYILTVTRSLFSLSAVGSNNSAVLGAVDSDMDVASFTNDTTFINALSGLNAAQLNNAARQLSPISHTSSASLSMNMSQRLSSDLSGYLGARRYNNTHWAMPDALSSDSDLLLADASGDPELLGRILRENEKKQQKAEGVEETNYFFTPFGTFYDQDSTDTFVGFNAKSIGAHFGYDSLVNDNFIIGLGGAYAHSFIYYDSGLGEADVDSFRVGPYGSYFKDHWFVDASATFGYHTNRTQRKIQFGGIDRTAKARYDAYDLSAFLKMGCDIYHDQWAFTPSASIQYTCYRSESFKESGADSAGLSVDAETQQSLLGRLGLRLHTISVLSGTKVIPEMFVGYAHQFIDENSVEARFVNGVTKFSSDVDSSRDDSVYYGVGLASLLSEDVSAFVRYEGESYSGGQTNSLNLGLTIRF